MEEYMYGRLTTLNKLNEVRNDPTKHDFDRLRAHRAMQKIIAQLKDRKLMDMRIRLIKATQAGDTYEVWKIENQMRAHEGRWEDIENEQ